ncbi:MAG: KpsF/GutQ family sugar-phosphate isomerase [Planctomycetota bacterium]|nr:KpsF/GutQ family sugar-phosphate isomerase [Planctomycetota bacterium]
MSATKKRSRKARDERQRARALERFQGRGTPRKVDLAFARQVLRAESRAVANLAHLVDGAFREAAELILEKSQHGHGRVVGTGMGKAGMMALKFCATLASTGTPALFMHPAEALHGDLGMVTRRDVLVAFSNSGESEEVVRLLPAVKKVRAAVVAITGAPDSSLGKAADVVLEIGRIVEPCPLRLAPSASTTAMLALGDALALCVLKARGLTVREYARLHPGGALGRKLMLARDLMRGGDRMVLIRTDCPVGAALDRMTKARCGAAMVVDARGKLLGVFTDGDFRRLMLKDPSLFQEDVGRHMTSPCRHILDATLVAEAQELMAEKRINALPVVDRRGKAVGILDIQDLVGWPVL